MVREAEMKRIWALSLLVAAVLAGSLVAAYSLSLRSPPTTKLPAVVMTHDIQPEQRVVTVPRGGSITITLFVDRGRLPEQAGSPGIIGPDPAKPLNLTILYYNQSGGWTVSLAGGVYRELSTPIRGFTITVNPLTVALMELQRVPVHATISAAPDLAPRTYQIIFAAVAPAHDVAETIVEIKVI